MTDQPTRCVLCGAAAHPDGACAAPLEIVGSSLGASCRNCLPAPAPEWVACAVCGLAQRPGKAFCDFCGSRWRSEPATAPG